MSEPSLQNRQPPPQQAETGNGHDTDSHLRLRARDVSFGITTSNSFFQIIESISLSLFSGETVGILGPNGCGKSTLLRLLTGLEKPTSGSVSYGNCDPKLGMVFQHVQQNLVPWRTVVDNVALPAILARGDRHQAVQKAEGVLGEMKLSELAGRYPQELSGGQQQLVTLARWVANPPSILFVDEGWSMLDFVQRQRAYDILKRLAGEKQCAVCVVSHNISELAGVADRAFVLTERPARVGEEVALSQQSSRGLRTEQLWKAARRIFDTSPAA